MENSQSGKESEITSQMGKIANAIQDLHATISEIEKRLTPILRSEPENITAEKEAMLQITPFGQALNEYFAKIKGGTARLIAIRNRIEL